MTRSRLYGFGIVSPDLDGNEEGNADMPTIPWDEVVKHCEDVLAAAGLEREDARYVAEISATSEAFAAPTHGLVAAVKLARSVSERDGAVPKPVVARDLGAAVLIDGCDAPGQLGMRLALDKGLAGAKRHGICMVALRRVGWVAALGTYLIRPAREGFACQAWVQNSTCADSPPYGGIDGKFSTNPVALAFPTAGDPAVADFSTASYSMGRVGRMKAAGQKAPEAVFIDADGNLTDDPNVMDSGGTMFHTGGYHYGYKGYALGLWDEAMAALAGGSMNNPEADNRQCVNLLVIDPEAFAGREPFLEEVGRFERHVKSSRVMEGFDGIRFPGEGGFARLARAKREGLEISEDRREQLNAVAGQVGAASRL